MRKIIVLTLPFLFLLIATVTVFAQSSNTNIPERNGDYPDPAHPGIRVRVFVHEPRGQKPGNPTPTPAPVTCSDSDSNFVDGDTGWKLPANVNYYINTSSVPSSVISITTIAQNAFSEWASSITSGSPVITYAGNTSVNRSAYDSKNIIAWGRTSGSALGVTYTRYNTSTGLVVDVDTIMNGKFPWATGCYTNAYDASNILTHELGHWFGLDDEYSADYLENTMYGYGAKAETKKISPTTGDKNGINLIY